jgi:hypothetical protein
MTDDDKDMLEKAFPVLVQPVNHLVSRGETLDQAWLIGGAILAYTGIASIPVQIIKATDSESSDYPKVVGQINEYLRGNIKPSDAFDRLKDLFEALDKLPDWSEGSNDPTRMMHGYPDIDKDYKVGNVLLMAEVGSVSRHRPADGYYKYPYRIHVKGGLKDITALNPAQQEVIYAPGSAYLVEDRRTGKVKSKKGDQAHEHIYLRYVRRDSDEFRTAAANNKVFDLGDKSRHG